MKKYTLAVFIGRFQPLHNGHVQAIEAALKEAENVLVLVGSSGMSRSIRNPFTYRERADMIREALALNSLVDPKRVIIRDLPDRPYGEQAWIAGVQHRVNEEVLKILNEETPFVNLHGTKDARIALVGYKKDGTSYYLDLFPEWDFIDTQGNTRVFNSTDIRKAYFNPVPRLLKTVCPSNVVHFLEKFMNRPEFSDIVEEARYVEAYKEAWSHSPYPPVFVTVDSVVIQSGHVLLIKRGESPGKGLYALPGGFINPDEYLRDSAVRELREETEICDPFNTQGKIEWRKIPPKKLASFIDDSSTQVFDYPYRSVRGRTITHAFLFKLPNSNPLWRVTGKDDAVEAVWVPLGELDPEMMFEDHYAIIQEMVGL